MRVSHVSAYHCPCACRPDDCDGACIGARLPDVQKGVGYMPKGIVKWFNSEKGYGFIRPDDGGKDIFVHITAVRSAGLETLADNQPVEYELIPGRDGRTSAGQIRVV